MVISMLTMGEALVSPTEALSQMSVWAVLFSVLLALVVGYAFYRLMNRRSQRQMAEERMRLQREYERELTEQKRQVLSAVSQELLTPITLIISPLQQMASEPLSDDVRGRVQMILRSAQLLLHQVNMLPMGTKGGMMPSISAVMPTVPTALNDTSVQRSNTDDAHLQVDDHTAAGVMSSREEEGKEGTEASSRFTMLMVDDSADMCRFVHDYFRAEYEVITAGNGMQALERLEENDSIDLVVSDVTMPKMNGLELCKQIKSDLRWSHIPVILLTGRRDEQLEMEGLRQGADDYITKPFNVEMLRLKVKKFIEKKETRQRQFREKMDVAPSDITITSVDEQFIQRAIKICEDHISDTEFSVEALGRELSLSRTYLYKKLLHITGKGPAEFIRTIRLKRGKQYLEQSALPIADIAAALGYGNPKRFTENFKAEYGMSPSEYAKQFRVQVKV